MLHGVSIFFEERDRYARVSATVRVFVGDEIRRGSLLFSQTGSYKVDVQRNISHVYHGFDVLFDELLVLRRNVQYCIAVSHNMPDLSVFSGFEGDEVVECHGVTFTFEEICVGNVFAEFLFNEDL